MTWLLLSGSTKCQVNYAISPRHLFSITGYFDTATRDLFIVTGTEVINNNNITATEIISRDFLNSVSKFIIDRHKLIKFYISIIQKQKEEEITNTLISVFRCDVANVILGYIKFAKQKQKNFTYVEDKKLIQTITTKGRINVSETQPRLDIPHILPYGTMFDEVT